MIIGVPKEIKDNEARVGVTPAGVKALTEAGHKVLVETQAGALSGFPDEEYQNAGAEIVGDAGYVWGKSEMVVKVKEPIETRVCLLPRGAGPVHLSPPGARCPVSPTSSSSPKSSASPTKPCATAREPCPFSRP